MKELGLWLALSFAAILGIAVFDRWHQRRAMLMAAQWAGERLAKIHKRPPPITEQEIADMVFECRDVVDNVDAKKFARMINERMNACPRI